MEAGLSDHLWEMDDLIGLLNHYKAHQDVA
jgi:hypothetical protein